MFLRDLANEQLLFTMMCIFSSLRSVQGLYCRKMKATCAKFRYEVYGVYKCFIYVPLISLSLVVSRGWKVAFFLPLQQLAANVSSPKTTINILCDATFHPMDTLVVIIEIAICCSEVRPPILVVLGASVGPLQLLLQLLYSFF